MSRAWAPGLALASGLLLALSLPGPGLWPLALVAQAPLLLALAPARPWSAAGLGALAHATFAALALRFVWSALHRHGAMSWPLSAVAFALLVLVQSLRGAALGLLASLARRWLPWPAAFLVALLAASHWPVVLEGDAAVALHDQPALLAPAALGGARLVSALAALAAVPVAWLGAWALGWRWPRWWASMSLLVVASSAALGARWSARQAERERAELAAGVPVGVVHGDIALAPEGPAHVEGWLALRRAHEALEAQGAALVVWPETSAPFALRREALAAELGALLGESPRTDALIGALIEDPGGTINGAVRVTPSVVAQVYGKHDLLPFGEEVPLERWLPWLRALSPRAVRLRSAPEQVAPRWREGSLGVSICYEGLSAERIQRGAGGEGPSLLVNLSNDAWFAGTDEPWLHLAATRGRAVEQGRFLVRATNAGVSAVVTPSGRLGAFVAGGPTRPLLARVALRAGSTPFSRAGGIVAWMCVGVVTLLLALPSFATPLARMPWRRREPAESRPE